MGVFDVFNGWGDPCKSLRRGAQSTCGQSETTCRHQGTSVTLGAGTSSNEQPCQTSDTDLLLSPKSGYSKTTSMRLGQITGSNQFLGRFLLNFRIGLQPIGPTQSRSSRSLARSSTVAPPIPTNRLEHLAHCRATSKSGERFMLVPCLAQTSLLLRTMAGPDVEHENIAVKTNKH